MELLGEGKFLRLLSDDGWEFAERINVSGVVIIIPVTSEGEAVFVEQYRRPIKKRTIEWPAGLVGDKQSTATIESAARTELLEETGYTSKDLYYLTSGYNSPGSTNEHDTIFMAPNVVKVSEGGGVDEEDIIVHTTPVKEAHDWINQKIAEGLSIDPKIWSGLYWIGLFHDSA